MDLPAPCKVAVSWQPLQQPASSSTDRHCHICMHAFPYMHACSVRRASWTASFAGPGHIFACRFISGIQVMLCYVHSYSELAGCGGSHCICLGVARLHLQPSHCQLGYHHPLFNRYVQKLVIQGKHPACAYTMCNHCSSSQNLVLKLHPAAKQGTKPGPWCHQVRARHSLQPQAGSASSILVDGRSALLQQQYDIAAATTRNLQGAPVAPQRAAWTLTEHAAGM